MSGGEAPNGGTAPNGDASGGAAPNGGAGGGAMGAGGGFEQSNDSLKIIITGGSTYISAAGDGLDSNGNIEISGGTLIVEGPTSNADGALDYAGQATITGGTVLMVGSAGMAQNFSGGTQAFAMQQLSGTAGQTVTLLDSTGAEVAAFTATKNFQVVQASAPGATDNSKLTVKIADTSTELTASTTATNTGFGGGGAGMQGGMGGAGGANAGTGAGGGAQGGMGGQSAQAV